MEEFKKIEEVASDVKEYINTTYEINRLMLIESSAIVGAKAISRLIVGTIIFLLILFLSLAGGFFMSHYLNDYCLGFLSVAGLYLLLSIIFFFGRRVIIEIPARDRIVRKIFTKKSAGH